MTSQNILKDFKEEFLHYLEGRIPDYRMPASKFFSSFNASLKTFAKKQGENIASILEVRDISLLIEWHGKLGQNERSVFNPRHRETKAQEGLRYYIDFLREKESNISSSDNTSDVILDTSNEVDDDTIEQATEGLRKEITFFRRSRNRSVRNECARRYGYKCYVCGMDFEKVYGDRGHEFIEVHHIKPLASYEGEHEISIDELVALCSNCHSMVHHGKTLLSVDKLKELYELNKNNREL